MRRQAWWGGCVAAVLLSCAGTGSVEPVAEEPVARDPEPRIEDGVPVVDAVPMTPQRAVVPALPTVLPPQTPAVPLTLEPEVEGSITNDQPLPPQTAVPKLFPEETGTPIAKGSAGWTFLTSAHGLPPRIYGASADEAGNLWVAGGNSGVYVLKAGQTRFIQASTPYPAISIAGGAPGVAYVGYMGLNDCDMAWDTGGTAEVYKSGDADRLTLSGTTITRQHYDISSGPNIVADEPQGREKLCNIFRIAYHAPTKSVWFGGNHGVAWGHADHTQVIEHTHPAINGWMRLSNGDLHFTLLSGDYPGLGLMPNGDLWIGGRERSAFFPYASRNENFWTADLEIQSAMIDVWPDEVPMEPRPEQAVLDDTHGFAPLPDGSAWVGSKTKGIAYLDATHKPVAHFVAPLIDKSVTAMALDPLDNSVWAGHGGVNGKGGLTRIVGATWNHYAEAALGQWSKTKVADIQVQKNGPNGKRRILVTFQSGAVGIYEGD